MGSAADNAPAPSITIRLVVGYRFLIVFGSAFPTLVSDEPEPIGREAGPSPEQLLIASVSNCLCASLAFALGKYRQESNGIAARASARVTRNAEHRLRLSGIDVEITLGAPASALPRLDRVLEQFETFCTVSESVKAGIPIAVAVHDVNGDRVR